MRYISAWKCATLARTLGMTVFLVWVVFGCSGSDEPTAAPVTSGEVVDETAVVPTQSVPNSNPVLTISSTSVSTASPISAPNLSFDDEREAGFYEGVTFVVGEGSEATFTVQEQLARLTLPNDAVMRTTALSGEIHLDSRASVVKIDLHKLTSDQGFRDRYVRNRMFGGNRFGTFTLVDILEPPEAFVKGEVATISVTGKLEIIGVELPLTLDVEARDDGRVINILGRTTFTWEEFKIPVPRARSVISVEDEVRVEVLLVARPLLAP